ncbi:hypothetical protein [Solemya elarraichensis gill symbiont]|uniref:Uncharacterized protein n=1 Tax=Solemya elarraichensis gill symbiont TaxID=1918949 RepID=A0A1T2KW37_9GAMM|nr:hypothetical protein [Solemya elarraichensis gill symbiont]OOZ37069.1 hypothetical protein BOW52_10400 [Solemya elarraichensis gill symbiont]
MTEVRRVLKVPPVLKVRQAFKVSRVFQDLLANKGLLAQMVGLLDLVRVGLRAFKALEVWWVHEEHKVKKVRLVQMAL